MKKYLLIYILIGWGFAGQAQTLINGYEYWFNSNTGEKTAAIVTPAQSFELALQTDASHLPDGLNSFTLRFSDDSGIWSSPLTRFFVKLPEQQHSTETKNIVAWEYRFNSEAMISQEVTPATTHVLDEQISTANLPDGLNNFTVRFRDNFGNWSSPLTRFFVKMPEQQYSTEPRNIVAWEYQFNREPVVIQEVTPATTHILDEQLDAINLSDGLNTFTVRFKDEKGNWSSPLTHFFVKLPEQQHSTEPKNIIAWEYRINNEIAVKQDVPPTATYVMNEQIDATHLADGLNVFTVRFSDNMGNWSPPMTRFIVKLPELTYSAEDNLVKAYEYRIEDATGKMISENDSTYFTFISFDTPVNPALIEFDVALNQVPKGDYTIHFRAIDVRNLWSSVLSKTVQKEGLPIATFTTANDVFCTNSPVVFINKSIDADTVLWDFGDGSTSAEFEPVHFFAEAGEYEVALTAIDSVSGRDSTFLKVISVNLSPATEEFVEICEGEVYSWSGNDYAITGSYNETFTAVNGCDSTATLQLEVNPVYDVFYSDENTTFDFQVNDSFEDVPVGERGGWTIKYNGTGDANQKVVDTKSKNGTKSLQLEGKSSWAAELYKNISGTPEKLNIEGWINVEKILGGLTGGIDLVNPDGATWGARISRLQFYGGRISTIYYPNGSTYDIQPYTAGEWYHIRMEHNLVARVYSVYINGNKVTGTSGGVTTDLFPMHPSIFPTQFGIFAGNSGTTKVFFDDLKMFESSVTEVYSNDLPFEFGSQMLTETGTFTETFQTFFGCDSTVTINLNIIESAVPTNLQVVNATLAVSEAECFNALENITIAGDGASVVFEPGSSANIIAGQSIRFLPGFHASEGSNVLADITTSGTFCDDLPQPIMVLQPEPVKSTQLDNPPVEINSMFDQPEMLVYPNPNNGVFSLEFSNFLGETQVRMFNSIGQLISDQITTETPFLIYLPGIKSGMYFIKAINNNKQFDQKIIVK